jgi:hypothetical protein
VTRLRSTTSLEAARCRLRGGEKVGGLKQLAHSSSSRDCWWGRMEEEAARCGIDGEVHRSIVLWLAG